jgi:hypothetical protein
MTIAEINDEAEAEQFLQQIRARRAAAPIVIVKPKTYTAEDIHRECLDTVDEYDEWFSSSARQKRRREMKKINAAHGTNVKFEDLYKLGKAAVLSYWFVGKEVQLFDKDEWAYCTYHINKPKTSGAKQLLKQFQELDPVVQDLLFIRDDEDYSECVPIAAYSKRYDVDRELDKAYKAM